MAKYRIKKEWSTILAKPQYYVYQIQDNGKEVFDLLAGTLEDCENRVRERDAFVSEIVREFEI